MAWLWKSPTKCVFGQNVWDVNISPCLYMFKILETVLILLYNKKFMFVNVIVNRDLFSNCWDQLSIIFGGNRQCGPLEDSTVSLDIFVHYFKIAYICWAGRRWLGEGMVWPSNLKITLLNIKFILCESLFQILREASETRCVCVLRDTKSVLKCGLESYSTLHAFTLG